MGTLASMGATVKQATIDIGFWAAGVAEDWAKINPDHFWVLAGGGNKAKTDAAMSSLFGYYKQRAQDDSYFCNAFYGVVVAVGREKMGVELDPAAPLSVESITSAISGRIGIPLTNITDKEALKSDVLRYGATMAAAKTGLQLDPSDPFGKASITAAIASASGVPLTDITDKAQIRADLMAYGKAQMAEEIGSRVNGKMAQLVAMPAVEQMESMIRTADAERALAGMPELKKDQIAQRMLVVDGVVRAAAREEIATYEAKVCLWSKSLAKKGAQVMASRRYRERMKQSGWSKSWTRNGVIADGG